MEQDNLGRIGQGDSPHVPQTVNKFRPDMTDFVFALVVFVLGYVFARWVFFAWRGWGVAAFATAYLLAVNIYLMKKGTFLRCAETWFWMAVTWLIGASYALWDNVGLNGWRSLFLFGSAAYYIVIASGSTIAMKHGDCPHDTFNGDSPHAHAHSAHNYQIVDGFNALVILPFRNFFNQYASFKAISTRGKRGRIMAVLLGIVLALIMVAMLIPLLRSADSGGFEAVADFFASIFKFLGWDILLYIIIAIPAAAYIYGLVSGAAHKKGTDIIKPESLRKTVGAIRVLHTATVYVVLGAVCGLYLVFIFSQLPYFFSAFTGHRPEGWLVYSEYARRGFFELCRIAVINLVLLTLANVTCKRGTGGLSPCSITPLKVFNIALAVITLVLIATAFSKMALYIDAYGLTMLRVLPCVFMLFIALVFVACIILQRRRFPIVRFALITGVAMMCVMCLINPDALVVRYNADRYLSGTLREFDTEVLWLSEYAGLPFAIDVYRKTADVQLLHDIEQYLVYLPDLPDGRAANEYSIETWSNREAEFEFGRERK